MHACTQAHAQLSCISEADFNYTAYTHPHAQNNSNQPNALPFPTQPKHLYSKLNFTAVYLLLLQIICCLQNNTGEKCEMGDGISPPVNPATDTASQQPEHKLT